MELSDFLLARISEDEAVARRGGGESWKHRSLMRHPTSRQSVYADDHEIAEVEHLYGWHIARWDPARVLAECEAKRRIVTLAARVEDDDAGPDGYERGYSDGWSGLQIARSALRLLALPYADHPDYDEAWRP